MEKESQGCTTRARSCSRDIQESQYLFCYFCPVSSREKRALVPRKLSRGSEIATETVDGPALLHERFYHLHGGLRLQPVCPVPCPAAFYSLWKRSRCVKGSYLCFTHRDHFTSSSLEELKTLYKDPFGERNEGLSLSTLHIPCLTGALCCLCPVSN